MAETPTLIGSVQRALHLLDAVGASERPATAKGLARRLDLALPTTYHLLRTLVYEGYLRKLEDGYVLGERIDSLRAGNPVQGVVRRARPLLRALRDNVNGAAYLSLYQDGEISLLDVVDGPAAPRADLWVGVHESGHATAFGKCILAGMDSGSRDDYLSRHPLADLTPHTITDARTLERRLMGQRDCFADREEYRLGTVCLAAPIRAPGLLGAVAVSVPARRYPSMATASAALVRTARQAARALAVL
jgi:DNA-binding IclR family transcriptional regulator